MRAEAGDMGPITVTIRVERDIAAARLAVSRVCDDIGGRALRKVRFVTAVSEIARNTLDHGGGGEMVVEGWPNPPRVEITCRDEGPGIDDIDQALQDGFSTRRSMGKGLGGARRLVDRFEIHSTPGEGTQVRMSSTL